mgnify:CR=1 FL=1
MSRIDQLLNELAPSGVPLRALGELGDFVRGNGLQKSDLKEEGFPAIHYGQIHTHYGIWADSTKSFTDPVLAAKLRRARPGDLVIATTSEDDASVAKATAWLGSVEAAVSGDAYIYRHSLDPRYIAYFFNSGSFREQKRRHISGTKVRRISGASLAKIQIPVPPVEVQREIVRVLDQFTQLEADLEAELEARRRQYEYYRGALLQFDPTETASVELSEAFEIRNGYTPAKSDPSNWVNGTVPWFRMEDIRENGHVLDRALQKIPEKAVKGGRCFPAGSLIFATSATIGEHALVTVPFLSNQRFTAIWPKRSYADRFDMKFLFYFGFVIDEWCRNNTTTSSFASVDMNGFRRLRIPMPPLHVQQRIAEQLDHFDALVNDTSIGLPAELAARRKQYEYYRDKLLTFEEAAA